MRHAIILMLIIFLTGPVILLHAGGRRVFVTDTSGLGYRGELLCVTTDEVILSDDPKEAPDSALQRNPILIRRVPLTGTLHVQADGESHVGTGIAVGAGCGLAAGLISAMIIESDDNGGHNNNTGAMFGESFGKGIAAGGAIVVGFVGGLVVGTVAGMAASTSDVDLIVYQGDPGSIQEMSRFARYPDGPPAFLRKK